MIKLTHLFSPIQVGLLKVKNRIVQAPMSTHLADAHGEVTDRLLNYYEERARGGAGLIIAEFSYIDDKASKCAFNQLGVYDDTLLQGLAELAERMKSHGAVAGLQICHAGSQRVIGKYPLVAPSPIPWEETGLVPKELTGAEIEEIIAAFAQAALRAKRAGFDLVEILAGHGYLINQFLSGYFNKRQDKYGGSLSNRMRFALEVAKRIKEAVGKDFPISFRINGDDFLPGGINLEEAKGTAKKLAEAGIDLLHVSAGTRENTCTQVIPLFLPRGYNLHLAFGIKEVVDIPVVACGAINDPVLAEQIIREGKADLVSMARPLLADPDLPVKTKRGNLKDIRPCIRCNECVSQIRISRAVKCAVNFIAGREGRFALTPVACPKEVLVIGGGPAGLEAALVSALRGHRVTLVERERELGGHLRLASFLDELRELLEYYLYELERAKVGLILGQEATAQLVAERGAQAVIVAVGGEPVVPEVPGIGSSQVITVLDLFDLPALGEQAGRSVEVGDRVLVAGGDLIGCETAWVLAGLGKELTIIDEGPAIPYDVERGTAAVFMEAFMEHGVRLYPGARLERIGDGGVEVNYGAGQREVIPVDTVVLALGFTPKVALARELESGGRDFRLVGDCRVPGRLMGAIHDGALAGWEV